MPAAVTGLKHGMIVNPHTAAAYLCAAIVDATSNSATELEDIHRGQVARKVAISAMINGGATSEEAPIVVADLVQHHLESRLSTSLD